MTSHDQVGRWFEKSHFMLTMLTSGWMVATHCFFWWRMRWGGSMTIFVTLCFHHVEFFFYVFPQTEKKIKKKVPFFSLPKTIFFRNSGPKNFFYKKNFWSWKIGFWEKRNLFFNFFFSVWVKTFENITRISLFRFSREIMKIWPGYSISSLSFFFFFFFFFFLDFFDPSSKEKKIAYLGSRKFRQYLTVATLFIT